MTRKNIIPDLLLLALILSATGIASAAEKPVYQRQQIRLGVDLAFGGGNYGWKDLNEDGRMDLIGLTTSGTLLVYRQNQTGFPSIPTQSWSLPPNTTWARAMDVMPDPGMEIVFSEPDGIYCYRQNKSGFDPQPVLLIKASQVQPKGRIEPALAQSKDGKDKGAITTKTINTVFADHYDRYQVDDKYRISLVKRVELENRNGMRSSSSKTAMQESGSLMVSSSWYRKRENDQEAEKSNLEPFQKERLAKLDEEKLWAQGTGEDDVNGDGAKDWVVWFMPREMNARTVFEIYLRQQNGKLPEKPTVVRRYSGGPAHGDDFAWNPFVRSPFININSDGLPDIFLLELRNKVITASGFLEMALKNGLDLTCAVTLGRKGEAFPAKPDFRMDITVALPWNRGASSLVSLKGDFNQDGRPDLLVRRTATQLDVYPSSRTGDLFNRQPAFTFEISEEAAPIVDDYNGDGISDLCLENWAKKEIVLFLSQKQN